MSDELVGRVIEIFRTVCQADHIQLPSQIDGTMSLSTLGLNSLLFIKVIVKLETEFHIDFEDEAMDVRSFIVMNDIVEYIKKQLA